MNPTNSREKHYKKIGLKRYLRIVVTKVLYTLFLLAFLGLAGFATYNPDLLNEKFNHYIDEFSSKLGISLKSIIVHESVHYCTSVKPLLEDIEPGISIFLVPIEEIKERLDHLDCTKNVLVRRQYPDSIIIEVEEKKPIAIWQNNQKFYYITEDGQIMSIKTLNDLENFLVITGKNAPINAVDLVGFLEINQSVKSDVVSATWVGDRRWDIKMNTGMIVMLPEENPEIAWNKFTKIISSPSFIDKGYGIVDLRIAGRVYSK